MHHCNKNKEKCESYSKGFFIVLSTFVIFFLWSICAVAAPSFVDGADSGDCAACHEGNSMVKADHIATKGLTYDDCASCHKEQKDSALSLAQRLPGVHYHLLSGIGCDSCHEDNDYEKLPDGTTCKSCHSDYVEKTPTKNALENPHDNHMGDLDCKLCHKMHEPSVNFCAQCHSAFDYIIP